MPKARVKWPTTVTFIAIAGAIHGQEPSLAAVVERLGAYAAAFQARRSSIVAEERYVQDVTYRNLPPNRFASETHRELRSDVLLVQPNGSDGYVEFRDVFEVDGRAVRDRQDRLATLFLDPGASGGRQIQQINRESARYNIGNVERTINTPTLALQFALPRNQPRFRFTRSGRTAPAMSPSSGTPRGTVIEYEETQRPTVIRTTGGLDLPARGRFWADPETGRVLMTELIAEDPTLRATIDVTYQWDPRAESMVPAEMHERYEARRDGAVIVGAASYGKIRQFQVQADERLGPAKQAQVEQPGPGTAARTSGPIPDRSANDVHVKAAEANNGAGTDAPLVSLSLPSPQDQARPPAFKADTELVLVDFVVTDKAGRPVRGLSAKDVVVREDGKERPIVSFDAFGSGGPTASAAASIGAAAASPPRDRAAPRPSDASTVVLVDDVHLTPDQAARLRPALRGLLMTVGGRSGSLMLVAPGSHVSVLAVLPTSAAAMAPAVDTIVGHRIDEHTTFPVADAEALAIARRDNPTIARVAARFVMFNPELARDQAETLAIERGIQVAHDARSRRDAIYDVALPCLDWLASRDGRHSLIIVSGGFAADPDDAKYGDVVTRSLRANAPIDFLDARGLSGFNRYHDVEFGPALARNADEGPFGRFEAAEGSTGLAVDTGGIIVANTNDMEKGLDELLDTMTTYYVLAYQPLNRDKPGYRKIKVEVRARGLHVRARTGYFSSPRAGR